MRDAMQPGLTDEELDKAIHSDWAFWGTGFCSIRGCPVRSEYRERIANMFGIPAYKKWEATDAYYFFEEHDKNRMADDTLETELWFCWE